MTSVEERVRAATRAEAETMHEVRPLRLPPVPGTGRGVRPARRFRGWAAPIIAAAAVVALAVSLVLVRELPNGRVVPPAPSASSSGVPKYYVAIPGDMANAPVGAPEAVVGDTFSGKRLAALRAPAGWKFVSVAAAADDRTFVVGAEYNPQPPGVPLATRWYLLRVTPGSAVFATLRELPIPAPSADEYVDAMGLSPDGTRLAMIGTATAGSGATTAVLRVYSVATGAMLHAWSSSLPQTLLWVTFEAVSWTSDGRQLAFRSNGPGRSQSLGIRMLPADDPGHDLLADSRLVWSTPIPGTLNPTARRPFGCGGVFSPSTLITGDGKTVVCGASGVFRDPGNLPDGTCPAVPPWNDEGVLEYSTATGKVTRTLYRSETSCVPFLHPVELLWASASGDAVIGFFDFSALDLLVSRPVIRFGLFTEHKFTPLPAPPTMTKDPLDTAW